MFSSLPRRALLRSVALLALALAAGCSKQSADEHFRKGNDYLQRSQLKEAVVEYRSAVQVEPKRGDIRLKLADTLMLQYDGAGALKEYVRAADLLQDDAVAQIKAGSMLLAAGAFEDAKSRANKAISLDPKNVTAQILLGNALAGLKDTDGAIAEYQEALALNPAQSTAYGNIAIIHSARGENAEAEASFRKAIDAAPKSIPARLALASFLWVNQRNDEAEKTFKEALAIDPMDLPANRAIGSFYMGTNRRDKAEPYFQTIVKAAKTTSASFSLADYYVFSRRFDDARKILQDLLSKEVSREAATIRLAAVDAAQGDRAQAVSRLREVLEKHPKELSARLLIARLMLVDGKRDQALAEATTIVHDAPNSPLAADAYLLIGGIHASNDRPDDAIAAYEEALKRQQQPFAADIALASLQLEAGALDKAATYARQALDIEPQSPGARAVMIRILLAQKEGGKAKELLASLQKDFPNSVGVFELLGNAQLADGQIDAARVSYTKAAQGSPNSVQALTGLIRTDLAAGHKADAVGRLESALKAQHTAPLLLLGARTYAAVGDSAKAEEMLTQAIEVEPTRLQTYALLGALYVGEKRLNEARDQFQKAVDRNPTSVVANTVLGMVFGLQNNLPEAEKHYKTALAADAHSPVAANNLAWLYASSNRNLDEALQLAQTAQQVMPDDPDVNDTLGWIFYLKKMTDPAIQHLQLSADNGKNNPATLYHLGRAYMQAGDLNNARKSLQRALDFNTDFEGAADARKLLSQIVG